jgi:hypothetical protein
VVIEDVGGHAGAAMVPNETFEASVGTCREHIGVRAGKEHRFAVGSCHVRSRVVVGSSIVRACAVVPLGRRISVASPSGQSARFDHFGDIGRGDNADHLVALNHQYSAPGRRLHALQQCSDRLVGGGEDVMTMLPSITERRRTTSLEKRSICRLAGTDLRA